MTEQENSSLFFYTPEFEGQLLNFTSQTIMSPKAVNFR